MAVAPIQQVAGTATSTTPSVTLPSAPTVGNTLVAIMAADDYQTAAPTAGSGRGYTPRLSSQNNLGFYLWTRPVASGDSATTTFAIGSATYSAVIVLEIQGTYDTVGTVTTTNNAAAGTQVTSGLSPATADNIVLAVFGGTTTNTVLSGFTVDNGFTNATSAIASTSGGGRANAHVAYKLTGSTAATGTTTISWSGLASDRSGAQISFTAVSGGGGSNAGTFAGSMPLVTGSMSGQSVNPGGFGGSVPRITGSMTGSSRNPGTLNAALPKITGVLSGSSINPGTMAGVLPKLTGSMAGASTNAGAFSGAVPRLTGSMSGTSTNPGTFSGSVPLLRGQISDQQSNQGTFSGTMPKITGSMSGTSRNSGTLAGTLPKITGSMTGSSVNIGVMSGSLPTLTGSIIGTALNSGTFAGTMPLLTGRMDDLQKRDITIRFRGPYESRVRFVETTQRVTFRAQPTDRLVFHRTEGD